MSYARFSPDSDVYSYSDGAHIIVTVASYRVDSTGTRTRIDGPYDDAFREFDTGDDAARFLHELQGFGYLVPEDCADALVGELP